MQEQILTDERWPTLNTKLAACLCTLGFQVKKEQPYLTEIEEAPPYKRKTTIWLQPEVMVNDKGSAVRLQAGYFDEAWRAHKAWEEANPKHPMVHMRHALEARDFIIKKIIHGEAVSLAIRETPVKTYKTLELKEAATLVAIGYWLYERDNQGNFVFDASAKKIADKYNSKLEPHDAPEQWMKLALLNYEALNASIKQAANVPCVRRTRVVNGKERTLLLPINCPENIRVTFEHHFYGN